MIERKWSHRTERETERQGRKEREHKWANGLPRRGGHDRRAQVDLQSVATNSVIENYQREEKEADMVKPSYAFEHCLR